VPLWKQPQSIELAKQAGWYLVLGLLLLYLLFGVLRPMVRRLNEQLALEQAAAAAGSAAIAGGSATVVDGEGQPGAPLALPNRLDTARQIAKSEPKMVANVVKGWVNGSN